MKKLTSVKKRSSRAFICALLSGSLMSGIVTTALVSCDSSASSSDSNVGSGSGIVDPDFTETVSRFLEEGEKRNVILDISDLDILYGDTNNGVLGVCTRTNNNIRAITISNRLRSASAELRDEIILHELGHCALFRAHSDNPESIMHATNIIGQPWRESVLDELFFF